MEFSELQITIPEEVLFRDLDGESVLLHLGSGQYFGLDEVGTFVWNRLAEGCAVAEIEERLLAEYDVTSEQVRTDLSRLLHELCAEELLRARDV